jgi:predicted permease
VLTFDTTVAYCSVGVRQQHHSANVEAIPMPWTKRWRKRLRAVLRKDAVERELDEELAFHLEMETRKNLRAGMTPEQARRQARLAFGGVEKHKEEVRDARWLAWAGGLSLDLKLGFRMLVKHPGLTLVGGLAMAFAICIGAGTFQFINQFISPTLPLSAGERVVGVRYWDAARNQEALPLPHDLLAWRRELRTVEELGGFQSLQRNLATGAGGGEPVRVARMSPVGFGVARVPPLLGRALVEADAEPDAPPVAVLGHGVWQARFGGDPAVVGRSVRLGEGQVTVVGVMPEGFAFPKDHELWVPLRLDGFHAEREPEAVLRVFGRLAPGATLAEAQAEAGALAARMERRPGGSAGTLRAQVLPYPESLFSIRLGPQIRLMVYQVNVYAALFLVLVSANIALLMFARVATREREIVVRNALGARRSRIVTQLFAEALVLVAVATVLGLAAAGPTLRRVEGMIHEMGGVLPFWIDFDVSLSTALYATLLALLGAGVAGVVPALKATGRDMRARLQQAGAGAGGLRLGGIWTAIVVTQIAATVVFTGVAFIVVRQASHSASVEAYFPAERYLGVRVEMDRELALLGADTARAAYLRRYATRVRELDRRIAAVPGVEGVTLAERMPVASHAPIRIEVDGAVAGVGDAGRPAHDVFAGAVDLDFFDVMRTPVLAGRTFDSRDYTGSSRAVVVSASFVNAVLGGRGAVGRRIRYVDAGQPPGPWYEIVGVARDLVAERARSLDLEDPPLGRVYHPLDASRAGTYPLHLVAHLRGDPGALVPALHRAAGGVSPALRLHDPTTLDRANHDQVILWKLYADLVLLVSAVALLLSLAGIYAVMSFTVARRTREIGIRVALGARAPRVVTDILGKPLVQVAMGVALGSLLVGGVVWGLTEGRATPGDGALLMAWGLGMLAVCGLACIGPTLRALWVQPAVALRAEV